jgi:hypothetical protein
MRSNQTASKPRADSTDASEKASDAAMARLEAAIKACEALGDDALARHAGRTLLTGLACTADALLRDGGQALNAGPDKVGGFFDKAAAAFVQAVEGLHRRAVLADGAALPGAGVAAVPRAIDPLAGAIAAWGSPVMHGSNR